MHVPRRELERNFKEVSENTIGITYSPGSSIALEGAVVDLDIGTASTNSSALQVACPPPGIGAKKFQEISVDHHSSTYPISVFIALKNAGVDLDICTQGLDCSTLLVPVVACSPRRNKEESSGN